MVGRHFVQSWDKYHYSLYQSSSPEVPFYADLYLRLMSYWASVFCSYIRMGGEIFQYIKYILLSKRFVLELINLFPLVEKFRTTNFARGIHARYTFETPCLLRVFNGKFTFWDFVFITVYTKFINYRLSACPLFL